MGKGEGKGEEKEERREKRRKETDQIKETDRQLNRERKRDMEKETPRDSERARAQENEKERDTEREPLFRLYLKEKSKSSGQIVNGSASEQHDPRRLRDCAKSVLTIAKEGIHFFTHSKLQFLYSLLSLKSVKPTL